MASVKNGNVGAEIDVLHSAELPDFSQWTEEQVGFAPYWNPEVGKSLFARVTDKDDRDPEFVRYLMQAGQDMICHQGPADDAEEVAVKKGEYFSISVYFSLQGLFDLYREAQIPAWMYITPTAKVPTKKAGRSVYKWKVKVSPKTKALADAARAKFALEGRKAPDALPAHQAD